VRISGLDGEYKFMDLMNPRHSKSIDIYFGNDNAAARQWGRRTLTISWE
jgi:3D (Asp-Asp-Asp) domain-containing protein